MAQPGFIAVVPYSSTTAGAVPSGQRPGLDCGQPGLDAPAGGPPSHAIPDRQSARHRGRIAGELFHLGPAGVPALAGGGNCGADASACQALKGGAAPLTGRART